MSQPESGWFADPSRRHTYRFWDGTRWTNQVSDGGAAGIDPVDMDEASATTPPAPGTQAPSTAPTPPAEIPQPAGVEVTQRSGGGLSGIMGVLVGAIIVIVVLVLVFNSAGDDDSTTSTTLTVTTEEPSEAPPTSAP